MEKTQSTNTATFKITGNWDAQSKQLKAKFPKLTDADLKYETGKETEMLSRIQTRLNKTNSEVIDLIKNCKTEKV